MTKINDTDLQRGKEYEDFLSVQLAREGIILGNMSSRKYQLKRENLLGMEIKFDDAMCRTKNLYIETHESDRKTGGIYRDDENWLYAVGDYDELFIFGKKTLRRLEQSSPNWLKRPNKTIGNRGFLLPKMYARQIAEKVMTFDRRTERQ